MEISLADRTIRSFTISPRTLDKRQYWSNIQDVVRWSETYGCTGVLLFEGNDTFVNPWLAAHWAIAETRRICPLVAVNPVYMHPFSVAKMVSSFAQMYGRKVYLNMITGTALSYLQALSDETSHDDRYERLREYTLIIRELCASTKPVTFQGRYYRVSNLALPPGVPADLQPEILLSGQSDAARRLCRELGATGLQMLQPEIEEGLEDVGAIHFGIIARETEDEAWAAAHARYPENEEDQEILEYAMRNTDSLWKRQMKLASERPDRVEAGYWLGAFRNLRADCPYIVGDYRRVADVVTRLVRGGIDTFVLDIAAEEAEFRHAQRAFELAGERLRQEPPPARPERSASATAS